MIHYYLFIIHYSLYIILSLLITLLITVEKRGSNSVLIHMATAEKPRTGDIHSFLKATRQSFPRFCTEKRYKLITFAQ